MLLIQLKGNSKPPAKSYHEDIDNSWQNRARGRSHEEVEVFRKPDHEYPQGNISRCVIGRTDPTARVQWVH